MGATSRKLKYVCCCTLKFKNQILGLGVGGWWPGPQKKGEVGNINSSHKGRIVLELLTFPEPEWGRNTSLISYLYLILGRILLVIGLVKGGKNRI